MGVGQRFRWRCAESLTWGNCRSKGIIKGERNCCSPSSWACCSDGAHGGSFAWAGMVRTESGQKRWWICRGRKEVARQCAAFRDQVACTIRPEKKEGVAA